MSPDEINRIIVQRYTIFSLVSPKMAAGNPPLISADDEWSPLKAVIVGRAEDSAFPSEPRHMIEATMPSEHVDNFKPRNPFPAGILAEAQKELDNFESILHKYGIKTYRPSEVNWLDVGGYTGAMPRDGLLSVGNTLVEAPFAWGCRRNEIKLGYSEILNELSQSGSSRICRAPQINGADTIYNKNGKESTQNNGTSHWVANNSRPAFDAADFMRFGKTIIGQMSHVTNRKGFEYLQAVIPEGYTVEVLDTTDEHAMHIDATLLPLRKGVMIYHPERVNEQTLRRHAVFTDWELYAYPFAQPSRSSSSPPLYMCSPWLTLNALSIDEKTIVLEANDVEFARWLEEKFSITAIMCPFQHVNSIGGSFHCATVDLVRETVA